MVTSPLIHKKRYGNIYDYIIVFDEIPSEVKIPTFDKDVWVSIQINKKLDLNMFRPYLIGYHTHRFYRNKGYFLFFNSAARERLPVYNPTLRLHQHVTIKILIGDKKLKVKSRYGNSWCHVSGGVHLSESPEDAVRRELLEELDIVYTGEINLLSTKMMKINIPILDKPIKTEMYYYSIYLDSLPDIKMDKEELSQVKLGDLIVCK
jgi:hypothetical protein